jgi:hypothetical protein
MAGCDESHPFLATQTIDGIYDRVTLVARNAEHITYLFLDETTYQGFGSADCSHFPNLSFPFLVPSGDGTLTITACWGMLLN